MKKTLLFSLLFIFIFGLLISCSSTPAEEANENYVGKVIAEGYTDNAAVLNGQTFYFKSEKNTKAYDTEKIALYKDTSCEELTANELFFSFYSTGSYIIINDRNCDANLASVEGMTIDTSSTDKSISFKKGTYYFVNANDNSKTITVEFVEDITLYQQKNL